MLTSSWYMMLRLIAKENWQAVRQNSLGLAIYLLRPMDYTTPDNLDKCTRKRGQ